MKLKAADFERAEKTLVLEMHKLKSAGARRDFAKEIGVDWEEYLRLKRKYRFVLQAHDKEMTKCREEIIKNEL